TRTFGGVRVSDAGGDLSGCRPVAEGGVRNGDHVFPLVDQKVEIGGEVWLQLPRVVLGGDDDSVGDDVLRHLGVESRLVGGDDPGEVSAGYGVDTEPDGLPRLDVGDVGFVHGGPDLHAAQVLGD